MGQRAEEARARSPLVMGAPLDGTSSAVESIGRDGGTGLANLAAEDSAFDAGVFLEWAQALFDRVIDAWRARDPGTLAAAMDATAWDAYAQRLLVMSALPVPRSMMGAARVVASVVGAAVDSTCSSVVVAFEVNVADPPRLTTWGVSPEQGHWTERWLFQRPRSAMTHPSGAVATCGTCGAPIKGRPSDRCRYCGADVTASTGGWLVTRVETDMPDFGGADDKVAALREKMAHKLPPLPPRPAAGPLLQPPRAERGHG